ncbi:hypothetical protein NDU88_005272 [Pleurodeles waltl]|uniref:Uncharacterized protein n=1 Tax=Pleurodeles waltl TaxID=8319 RepID=A0AAV7QHD4_PLEWA|nr:hypothetical protein NDU88_005248 [Pleurodeles waltl]KAJ1138892.1 hypothetical protein NDU88_005272 [Pleurodeles waltl]
MRSPQKPEERESANKGPEQPNERLRSSSCCHSLGGSWLRQTDRSWNLGAAQQLCDGKADGNVDADVSEAKAAEQQQWRQ